MMRWFENWRWWMGCLLFLMLIGGEGSGQRLELRGMVEVRRETVLLSDLLPAGSSPLIREASAAVDLAASPKLGSLRVIEGAGIAKALSAQPELLDKLAIPDRVLVRRAGFPVARGAIVGAIQSFYQGSGQNVDLEDAELHWDSGWATDNANPKLEVERAFWDAARRRWQCWMRAESHGPDFLVELVAPKLFVAKVQAPTAANAPSESKAESALMKVGTKAWLVAESGGVRMQTEVICLESGGIGQQIRVRSVSGHRVFRAEIVGDKLLQARFAL
jgi:hypothetical protein